MRQESSKLNRAGSVFGFTLIELLVVIVIIGVLASVVGPRFFGRTEQSKVAAARSQIENLAVALDNYQLDTGYYPSTEQGLQALVQQPSGDPPAEGWRGPYLKTKQLPKDPWNNDFQYQSPGRVNTEWYDLISYGKDGKDGGDGDAADIANH